MIVSDLSESTPNDANRPKRGTFFRFERGIASPHAREAKDVAFWGSIAAGVIPIDCVIVVIARAHVHR